MILQEKMNLPNSCAQVWEIIRDPGNLPAWNSKCVEASSPRKFEEGAEFRAVFQLSGPPTETLGKIVTLEPEKSLLLRYFFHDRKGRSRSADESYTLSRRDESGCNLVHSFDLKSSGIPCWARCLIFLASRFGYKSGDGPLDELKALLHSQ